MAWVINSKFNSHLRNIQWRGRAGSIHLGLGGDQHAKHLYVVGAHGSHGDELLDSLSDTAVLVKRKPRAAELVLLGDWNVDQLPDCQADPWSHLHGRSNSHCDRRAIFSTFCDSIGASLKLPTGKRGG